MKNWLVTSGHKEKTLLCREGWYCEGECNRMVSNLYSVVSFCLMKDRIEKFTDVFDGGKLEKYRLPSITDGKLNIDEVWHEYSEDLCQIYEKLSNGDYDSYFWEEGGVIKNLSQEEFLVSQNISRIDELIQKEDMSGVRCFLENWKREETERLGEIKNRLSQYDREGLLKRVRHDFLHLSAKNDGLLDLFVNAPDSFCRRRIIKG